MSRRGALIVIEGSDGSGKGTQFKLLIKALKIAGLPVKAIDVPQYGKPSARLVERYLNGYYGKDPKKISAYDASLFYAVDRYELAPRVRKWLKEGKVLVANRYTLSNAAHQGGKITSAKERKKFWDWLFKLEHQLFDIPRPDITIILHMPAKIAQQLILLKEARGYLKGRKKDIHEADLGHLQASVQAYLELAKKYGFNVVECVVGGKLLTPQDIHHKLLKTVTKLIHD